MKGFSYKILTLIILSVFLIPFSASATGGVGTSGSALGTGVSKIGPVSTDLPKGSYHWDDIREDGAGRDARATAAALQAEWDNLCDEQDSESIVSEADHTTERGCKVHVVVTRKKDCSPNQDAVNDGAQGKKNAVKVTRDGKATLGLQRNPNTPACSCVETFETKITSKCDDTGDLEDNSDSSFSGSISIPLPQGSQELIQEYPELLQDIIYLAILEALE